MNEIIERIAPSRMIQTKRDSEPWRNKETDKIIKEAEAQLETAIVSKDVEEWRFFRSLRNQAFKFIELAKKNYFIERLANRKSIWREFRAFKGEEDAGYPDKIIFEGNEVASQRKMTEIFSRFFSKKIEDIQKQFNADDNDQLPLLEKLVEKPVTSLDIDSVSINEVYQAITKLKSTNATGYDQMTSRIVKMIPEIMAFWMIHLMNNMLRT